MKKLLFIVALVLFITPIYAQEGGCGTVLSAKQKAWLDQFVQNELQAGRQTKSVTRYIPLKAHIIGTDEGVGYYPVSTLLTVICELNVKYAPVNFVFYLYGDIDYINNSNFYNDGSSFDATNTMAQQNVPDLLNVYFVQASPGLCGYYSPNLDCVVIIGSCGQPGGTTITHEFGHFFNLPHTFDGWENNTTPPLNKQEKVNGSNCSTAGDKFCDTPADYISTRWNCPYTGTKLDQTGTPYNPDPTLYMRYSSDACQSRFSPQQITTMQADAANRPTMINHTPPSNFTPVTTAPTNCFPTGFISGMNPNATTFTWSKPAGAELTYLQIRKYGLGAFVADIITADSFYTFSGLEPLTAYQWKVKCFNEGNTCGNAATYTAFNYFVTDDVSSGISSTTSKVDCSIFPNLLMHGSTSKLVLTTTKAEEMKVQIVTLNGQLISEQLIQVHEGGNAINLNVSDLNSGIYMVKVESSVFTSTKKLVIQ